MADAAKRGGSAAKSSAFLPAMLKKRATLSAVPAGASFLVTCHCIFAPFFYDFILLEEAIWSAVLSENADDVLASCFGLLSTAGGSGDLQGSAAIALLKAFRRVCTHINNSLVTPF